MYKRQVWNHFFDMAENTELVEVEGRTVSAPFYLYLPGEDVYKRQVSYGVGTSANITKASIRAVFSALNRLFRQ